MKLLAYIMSLTEGWKCCWWSIKEYSNILDHAARLGFIGRSSTTQVYWKDKGIKSYHKYCKGKSYHENIRNKRGCE